MEVNSRHHSPSSGTHPERVKSVLERPVFGDLLLDHTWRPCTETPKMTHL